MVNRRAEPVQGFEMFRHAVAHMPLETIAGMGGAEAGHQPDTRDFGDDRCGGDRGDERIAAWQSQPASMRSRPSTKTSAGLTGSATTARANAHSEARRILSRSMRAGGASATAT